MVEKRFPGKLLEVGLERPWDTPAQNYDWELIKSGFLIYAISVCVISLALTIIYWKKGKGAGFFFFAVCLLILLYGLFYWHYLVYFSLVLFGVFGSLFAYGLIKKRKKLTFTSGLFICCYIIIILFSYFIGFSTSFKSTTNENSVNRPECNCDSLIGKVEDYSQTLIVTNNSLGYANVRKDHDNFNADFVFNICYRIPCKTKLKGSGPFKDTEAGAGFFYRVIFTDSAGKLRKGYMAINVVRTDTVNLNNIGY
jgi:hypothetical protein